MTERNRNQGYGYDYGYDDDDDRETIWGINRKDRPLFQLLTLLGGIAGSVALTLLEV